MTGPTPLRRLALGAALATTALLPLTVQAADYPAPVQQLVERGVDIVDQFDAPGNLTGYVGEMQGQPVAFYLTDDGQHVIIGPMLDAAGNNLTDDKVQKLVIGPKMAQAWPQLEQSNWAREGDANAETIVYTFTDPNCPYCHKFHEAAQPWVDAGKVQLRHVMVGILRADSLTKAATILGSNNPHEAIVRHNAAFSSGGIKVDDRAVSKARDQVAANNQLMQSLGLRATPSTFYKDADGQVTMKQGLPRPAEISAIMGSERPR
ncbi:thiol:disulfide interchange protein DsbG [Marinobacter sp. X15-166B]|uniref:thiol:disulfide interchange protein DsbG n=1 Tax=Marinobacter sp. X15-166B TaxID=1897620 RepID=UPI00085C86D8|nr:thiol:disulfide interchange protein DsbG [Marinobacter sp. X15-166B]OEY65892.1 thiol:disulfide interchange protein DsbG [Marinobacter sp. X15-166B]